MKARVVILGAGESGMGAAVLARQKNFEVFVSDSGKIKSDYCSELNELAVDWEEGQHSPEKIENADLIVKSPGIPDQLPLIRKLRAMNIPVISEIEFAGRYTSAFKICITGSNGKTTTTMLIWHMLKKAGLKVGLAGNVGQSFARQVALCSFDYYVLELSSFQLDGMFDFKADIAVLLNITPDHLNRYDYRMENYIRSKFRILQNMTGNDVFIYSADDPVIREELTGRTLRVRCLPFGWSVLSGDGAGIRNDEIWFNQGKNKFGMSIFDISLQGKHNTYNSMAAGLAGVVVQIKKKTIRESLSDFRGVEHRLERFISVHGIEFINDSKATNINSAWYALESMTKPVVWIVGGIDKGNDYQELLNLVREKVHAIVCLGTDNDKIVRFFKGCVSDIVETSSMADAVRSAYYLAKDGDVVLLSPACASFDLFESYEDRGRQFKQVVRKL